MRKRKNEEEDRKKEEEVKERERKRKKESGAERRKGEIQAYTQIPDDERPALDTNLVISCILIQRPVQC